MTEANYIPTGRASLVKRAGAAVQVQTEYASRPSPRVTTTISHRGQVLHKIERMLVKPIESAGEQQKTELEMRRQHDEILGIIERENRSRELRPAAPSKPQEEISTHQKLRDLPNVSHVFRVDNEGQLVGTRSAVEFNKLYGGVLKNLQELMSLFNPVAGSGGYRETGVVEIEPNRLYFASQGSECFFVVIDRSREKHPYEQLIKQIVVPDPFALMSK
jgi:hypothetical protein